MPPRHPAGTAEALKLWVVLSRAHAAIGAHAAADVARHDLTLAEFGVLEALYHKGRMLLGEVQRSLLVSSGGVTYLVDRLTARGLVRREACPTDKRARYAVLTDAGRALVAVIFPQHARAIADACAGLSEAEQQTVRALLRTLGRTAAGLDDAAPDEPAPPPASRPHGANGSNGTSGPSSRP